MRQLQKPIKVILTTIISALLILAYMWRYRAVNQELQAAPVQEYSMGEEVEMEQDILINYTMEGYSIKVNQAEVLSYEEFLEKYDAEDEYTHVPDKVYDVEVTLRNIDAKEGTGINLSELYIQGAAVCEGVNIDLLNQANPDLNGAYAIALRESSALTLHLPFNLYEEHFKKSVWRNLDEFPMNFVATLYPTKKVIHLSE